MKRRLTFYELLMLSLVLFSLLLSKEGYADDSSAPSWVNSTPTSDAIFRYYVGRASSKNDESEAFTEAARKATEQAIRENFGFETEIRTQAYETEKDTLLTKTISDISRRVKLEDFEQKESFKSVEHGEIRVWLLFRYKITSIEKEKRRLLSTPKDVVSDFQFSGNPLDAASGTLEVTSDPPGASVFLDRSLLNFIKTPLRIYGQISPGPHTLTIDHPTFETEERKFVFEVGKVNTLKVKLKKAMGILSIKSTPDNAKILINGEKYGKTPADTIKLPAGIPVRLELVHEETERVAQEVVVNKNAPKELNITLPLKPAQVQISSIPQWASFTLSGKKTYRGITPSEWLSIEPGNYSLKIEKAGYETSHDEFYFKGGERKLLPTKTLNEESFKLVSKDVPNSSSSREVASTGNSFSDISQGSHPYNYFYFGTSASAYSSNLSKLDQWAGGLSIQFEFKLANQFGLLGEYLYKVSPKQQYKNGSVSNESQGGRLGLPIYTVQDSHSHSFFVSPEMMWLSTNVKFETTEGKTTELKLTQTGYGVSVGGMSFKKDHEGMSYRIGIHQFSDTSAYKGATMVTISLGALIGN